MSSTKEAMSLQKILDEPKGKTEYFAGQSFMLQVFWEAPNLAAAEKVLKALERCAKATHRDTPCVPTYYFRLSTLDADLVSSKSTTIGEHPQLKDAKKKLRMGVPRPTVVADLVRRGLNPQLLDADPSTILPAELQQSPVMIECTEIYLDERSFYEHVGSKDYLAAYGEVMEPGLQNKQTTIRLGTPTAEIVEKILAPVLHETVELPLKTCMLWKRPEIEPQAAIFLSIDVPGAVDQVLDMMPASLRQASTTLVGFSHPLREGRTRVLSVQPTLPDEGIWRDLAALPAEGIEAHCEKAQCESVQNAMKAAYFSYQNVVREVQCGYLIHEKARQVVETNEVVEK